MSALLNTIGENMKNLNNTCAYAHKRGKIQDSAVKAIVTDPLFHSRSERNKKGKAATVVMKNIAWQVIKTKAHLKVMQNF